MRFGRNMSSSCGSAISAQPRPKAAGIRPPCKGPPTREHRWRIRKAGRWRGNETNAPVDGQGFRAGSSVRVDGGVTDSPRISSTEHPAKGSIRAIARWPPLSAAYGMRDHLALCFLRAVRRGDHGRPRPRSHSHGPRATFPVMIGFPPLHLEGCRARTTDVTRLGSVDCTTLAEWSTARGCRRRTGDLHRRATASAFAIIIATTDHRTDSFGWGSAGQTSTAVR